MADGSLIKEKSMRTSTLNWNEHLKCWYALKSGVKHMISTNQLNAPATMTGSAAKASEWWSAKQVELERQSRESQCEECQK
jgi:hypothetical protein